MTTYRILNINFQLCIRVDKHSIGIDYKFDYKVTQWYMYRNLINFEL